ncbi:pitrilysin family protein [Limibacter armeniacum]|uniref:M16 family metallopeptidase n=1 Tax=Limibacter armeniacum TaxID=466084 RepID=UPI002FE5495E
MNVFDRTVPPIAYPVSDFNLTKPQKYVLDNGIEVFALDAYTQPVLSMQLIFRGGKLTERVQGASYFAAKMLFEGTTQYSSAQISQMVEDMGATVYAQNAYDLFTIDAHCLSRYLPQVSQLVVEAFEEATFPEKEFEHARSVTLQNKKINNEKNNIIATRLFRQEMYGKDHPYSYDLSEEQISSFDRKDALAYYQQEVSGKEFVIFIAGAVKEEEIKVLNSTFGQLKLEASTQNVVYPDFALTEEGYQKYQERDQAVQTSLRIGRSTFTLHGEDRVPFAVANEILGGYFGSRLMRNIREDKGLTYGIYAGRYNTHDQGHFMIASDVQKKQKDLAIEEIYKEVRQLVEVPVSAEELSLVKSYMSGTFVMSINSYMSLLDYMRQLYFNGFDFDYYDHYVSRLDAVTSEQVQEMAKKYYNGPFIEVAVG